MSELISRSALLHGVDKNIAHMRNKAGEDKLLNSAINLVQNTRDFIAQAPAVDAVEVTAQEIQFLIDAMYRHIRWMIAGGLDKPECSFDERVALSEKLRLFELEHFPDMRAETEG